MNKRGQSRVTGIIVVAFVLLLYLQVSTINVNSATITVTTDTIMDQIPRTDPGQERSR